MKPIRVGTRGSELARRQTDLVCQAIGDVCDDVELRVETIATTGDLHPTAEIGSGWPLGGFTSTIETALRHGQIDVAVHSLKDLPTSEAPGVRLFMPVRDLPHDVLVTADPVELESVQSTLRIGTSSPRRTAQLRQNFGVDVVPIRGNVTTRLTMVGNEVDGVVLAAAGLSRLGIRPAHAIVLPVNRFVPAPGQGVLGVQVRADDQRLIEILGHIDDPPTRLAAEAERAFLNRLAGGCQLAAGGLAVVETDGIHLHGQVHVGPPHGMLDHHATGTDPHTLGKEVADAILHVRREILP